MCFEIMQIRHFHTNKTYIARKCLIRMVEKLVRDLVTRIMSYTYDFEANKNLCHKRSVLFYRHPREFPDFKVWICQGMLMSCISTAVILVCFPAESTISNVTTVTNVTSSMETEDATDISSILSVVFVLLFVVFFQFGAGPIPPFITSEMFQSSIR